MAEGVVEGMSVKKQNIMSSFTVQDLKRDPYYLNLNEGKPIEILPNAADLKKREK